MSTSGSLNSNSHEGRYLKFNWVLKSQNVVNNTSVISWELIGAGSATSPFYSSKDFKIVIDGVTVYSSASAIDLYIGTIVSSGDYTITHGDGGLKTFTASIEGTIGGAQVSGSSSWSLPEINRNAIITSVDNFTDIEDPEISFINPNNLSLRFNLKANNILIATRAEDGVRSPYTIALTESERELARDQSPNSNTVNITYELETLESGEAVYIDTASAVMRIVNSNPIISGISYKDINPDTIAITQDDSKIVEGYSILEIDIASIVSLKGSDLDNIDITINGVTVSTSLTGDTEINKSITFGSVNSSEDVIAYIVVTDSRGNTTSSEIDIEILAYTAPEALIKFERQGGYYTNTDLTVNAVISSLGGNNTVTIQYQYKESSSATWGTLVTITNNSTTTLSLDNTKAYDMRVIITDLITSATYERSVDIGTPIIFFDNLLRSVGINCLPSDPNSIEVEGINIMRSIFFKSGLTYTLSNIISNGFIGDNSTSLNFTIVLPRNIGVLSYTITDLKVIVRDVSGNLLLSGSGGHDIINDTDLTLTSSGDETYLTIKIVKSTAWSTTDNTPISVEVTDLELLFN